MFFQFLIRLRLCLFLPHFLRPDLESVYYDLGLLDETKTTGARFSVFFYILASLQSHLNLG